jgi:hypothetical protein
MSKDTAERTKVTQYSKGQAAVRDRDRNQDRRSVPTHTQKQNTEHNPLYHGITYKVV